MIDQISTTQSTGIVFGKTLKLPIREINFRNDEWGLVASFAGDALRRAMENHIQIAYARCEQAEDFRDRLLETYKLYVIFSRVNKSPVCDPKRGFELIQYITQLIYGNNMTDEQQASLETIVQNAIMAVDSTDNVSVMIGPPVSEPA